MTAVGSTVPGGNRHPIVAVVAGMRVVDSADSEVGTVEYVKMGDPEAVTVEGQEYPARTLADEIAEAVVGPEPDLPPSIAARLLRLGFVKVRGRGLDRDRYVSADQIADVTDDRVLLKVTRDTLARES